MQLTNTSESRSQICEELKKDPRLKRVYISDRDGGAVHFEIENGISHLLTEHSGHQWVQNEYFFVFFCVDHFVIDHFKGKDRLMSSFPTLQEAIDYAVGSQLTLPDYINKEEFQQLKDYFLPRNWHIFAQGFERKFRGIELDNLRVYFNTKQNQWRLKNTDNNQFSMSSMLDITNISFPFNEVEQRRVHRHCSDNHGVPQF